MARPRRSEGNRQKLLDEGVSVFLEQGYHGTGIQAVVDRAQVPKGSFYNYFESKEHFGAEAIRHFAAAFDAQLDTALESDDPVAAVRGCLSDLRRRHAESGHVGGCLVANIAAEVEDSAVCREALAKAMAGWRDRIAQALARGQEQGTVRRDIEAGDLAAVLLDAWEGAVIRMKIERSSKPLDQCLTHLWDTYLRP